MITIDLQIEDNLKKAANYMLTAFRLMGYDTPADEANFEDSPKRVAKAWMTDLVMPKHDIKNELRDVLAKSFPTKGDPGIIIQDTRAVGICPHHLLPVIYQIYVGYLPKTGGKVLGMSKPIRVAQILAKRPVLQEDLAMDIAATLYNGHYDEEMKQPTDFPWVETAGSFCIIGGVHSCIALRGANSFSIARESVMRGVFMNNQKARQEVFALIKQFPSIQFPF
jgi:GTP cyclohydrolase I